MKKNKPKKEVDIEKAMSLLTKVLELIDADGMLLTTKNGLAFSAFTGDYGKLKIFRYARYLQLEDDKEVGDFLATACDSSSESLDLNYLG